MNKQIEALKMAIEFIERHVEADEYDWLIQACKEALSEAEKQEPVPEYIFVNPSTKEQYLMTKITNTHPATWQSLSDDDMEKAKFYDESFYNGARWAEQILKVKNTQS